MDLLLTEQQNLFAETAARLCLDRGGPKRMRALRAADAEMDGEAWRAAIEDCDGPVCLLLTRQGVPVLDRTRLAPASGLARGHCLN